MLLGPDELAFASGKSPAEVDALLARLVEAHVISFEAAPPKAEPAPKASFGDDIEFFSKEQMAEVFDVERVNANPARFDLRKCTAINAEWIRALAHDDLVARLEDEMTRRVPLPVARRGH